MNKRTVNLSSLVILLALLSFIVEICTYYFIPQHFITVLLAAVISLALSHFFLETSLNYDCPFLHGSFMTICSVAFTIVVYLMQPNEWIQYDYSMIALVLVNWMVPFIYCFIRDFADRGPRFADYLFFFHGMSAVFGVAFLVGFVKQFFITPLLPPYEAMPFGAHNFIPFMATGNYIESVISAGGSVTNIIIYIIEMICFSIPFGFYVKVYLREFPFVLRLAAYVGVPLIVEGIQFITGRGRADIDDVAFSLIGTVIGVLIYHLVYRVSYEVHKRDFLEDRTVVKKLFNFNGNI